MIFTSAIEFAIGFINDMSLRTLAVVFFFFQPLPDQAQDAFVSYPSNKEDTIEALKNLFHRKRRVIQLKVAVITCMTDILIIKMWSQPGSPIQVVPPGSTVSPTGYVFLGLGSFIAANAIIENSRYGRKALKALLSDYSAGKKLPRKVKSKIKNKDFR